MFRTSFRQVGSRKGRYAFTLVELLVVVAILALLISILMPSLNKAKEAAISVVCKTNLKSIALATQTYTHDYNNWVHASFGGYSYWDNKTWDQVMVELDLLPEVGESNTLSYCPSRVTPRWDGPYYSYGQRMSINDYAPPDRPWNVGDRTYGWFNLSGTYVRCHRVGPDNDFFYPYVPSEFVLHADTLAISYYDYNSGRSQYYAFKDSMTTDTPTGYNFIEMRHASKANCAFADAHVEGLNRAELSNLGFGDKDIEGESGEYLYTYHYLWPLAQ